MSHPATVVTVLASFPDPRPTTNPYIQMLQRRLDATPGVVLRTFTWRRALVEPFDVFHAHWPESLLASGRGPAPLLRQALFLAFLVRLRLGRVGVVRTVHNRQPHDRLPYAAAALLRRFDKAVDHEILLNAEVVRPGRPASRILHGHYRDWFDSFPRDTARPGRVAFVGRIRAYKNVEGLVRAFGELPCDDCSLRVVGMPATPELAAEVRSAASGDPRVSIDLGYVTDEQLVRDVTQAELVVLPYRDLYNSGASLMVLSLDRPVLVPNTEAARLLADEVGDDWVITYDGQLTASGLTRALDRARQRCSDRPDLSQREWADVGPAHLAAYRAAARSGG